MKPPKCPQCNKPLDRVEEIVEDLYQFQPDKGSYKELAWGADLRIYCPRCKTKLNDLFEEGACNYEAKQ